MYIVSISILDIYTPENERLEGPKMMGLGNGAAMVLWDMSWTLRLWIGSILLNNHRLDGAKTL